MTSKTTFIWAAVIVLFLGLAGGGGYYFSRNFTITKQQKETVAPAQQMVLPGQEDTFTIQLYSPVNGRIEMTEKAVPRRTRTSSIAEAVIEEYFRLPINGAGSVIPSNVKLLGLYRDAQQILYLDLSDEVRRNFHADALSEYLLLRGLYETVTANIPDISDIKILVEGKEIDTLGGHMPLRYPLKNYVSYEPKPEKTASDE